MKDEHSEICRILNKEIKKQNRKNVRKFNTDERSKETKVILVLTDANSRLLQKSLPLYNIHI